MIKRSLSVILTLMLLCCLLPVSAMATGLPQPDSGIGGYVDPYIVPGGSGGLPQPDVYVDGGWGGGSSSTGSYVVSGSLSVPSITSHPYDVTATAGGVPAALYVQAYGPTAGQLGYQWYSLGSSPYGNRTPVSGYSASFTPPVIMGTTYYCVGVYSVSGGMRSGEVYSNAAAVSYSGIELISAPTKTQYAVGSKVDLSGLWVRIYDTSGSYWDSYNGNSLNVYPSSFDRAGNYVVEVSNGLSAVSFNVSVGDGTNANDPNHEHKFGEWEVTKEATCVTTGTRTRSCECGESETEDIPKTDHSWDEGTITKEPTKSSNGARLYTCTVCQANRSEIIPAGTQVSGSSSAPANSIEAAAQNNAPAHSSGSTYGGSTYSNMPQGASAYNNAAANAQGTNTYGGSTVPGESGTIGGAEGTTGVMNREESSSGWWLIPVSALLLVGTGIGAYYLMRKRVGND